MPRTAMLPGCGRLAIPALPHPPRTSMLWLRRPLLCLALLLYAVAASAAAPNALRVASAFDPQTMDPHALALPYHSRVAFQLYESLLTRDENFELEAGLATAWHAIDPTTWRFSLRAGVTFHDGTPFSADDAVFSLERALATPSQRAFHLSGVRGVRKVDNLTVELQLSTPDAMLPVKLQFIAMMSRPWAIDHGVERAQDFNGKQETFAVRNANGTGPFRLDRYEPDVRTELRRHPGWRGWKDGKRRHGNLDEVSFVSIKSDATRLAALASGEVDLVLDPPFQDVERLQREPRLAITTTTDIGTQYFTFDQATPTGALLSPRVDGTLPALESRLPYDPAKARALLKEAGYPDGFAVTLDCVNIAFRENVCQAAGAGRHPHDLGRVGDQPVLPEAHSGQRELRRIRLDADDRRLGVAGRAAAQLGYQRQRHLQRRPLFESEARLADRRDPRRARLGEAAGDGRHRAAHRRRRAAVPAAVPPQAQLGDAQRRAGGDVAE